MSAISSFEHENLIAGRQRDIVNMACTVAAGQTLERGDLLGRIIRSLGAVTADPGNTGEGTLTAIALGPHAVIGTYTITCVAAGPPAVFSVTEPGGRSWAFAVAEEIYAAGCLSFLIEAYGAGFAVGDTFLVEVEAGSGLCVQAALTALDGSAIPFGILAEDVDASVSLAGIRTTAYVEGEFRNVGLAYGETEDDWRGICRAVGIYLRDSLSV